VGDAKLGFDDLRPGPSLPLFFTGVAPPGLDAAVNLFLHYAFDTWMTRTFPDIPFAGGDARRFCASLGHRLF
jgi:hypothetical protein